MSEDGKNKLQKSGIIDWSVFSELIAMDEDEEGFSQSLFQTFVDQVNETFKEIDENLKHRNFEKVSSLGHYLKGSAAALGLEGISSQCERIQNYGHKNNFDNYEIPKRNSDISSDEKKKGENTKELTKQDDCYWVLLIQDAIENARKSFMKSREALNEYFNVEL